MYPKERQQPFQLKSYARGYSMKRRLHSEKLGTHCMSNNKGKVNQFWPLLRTKSYDASIKTRVLEEWAR